MSHAIGYDQEEDLVVVECMRTRVPNIFACFACKPVFSWACASKGASLWRVQEQVSGAPFLSLGDSDSLHALCLHLHPSVAVLLGLFRVNKPVALLCLLCRPPKLPTLLSNVSKAISKVFSNYSFVARCVAIIVRHRACFRSVTRIVVRSPILKENLDLWIQSANLCIISMSAMTAPE